MIVVGCGPAGATAARVAADRGKSIVIIDRKRSVGQPPRCAGFVPGWLPERAGVDQSSVIQSVRSIRLADGTDQEEIGVDACVIDRTRFDKTLAIQALEAGADLCNGFVTRREDRVLVARRNGFEAAFQGAAIVCADGAASVVSRSLKGSRRRFLATMQFEVGLDRDLDTVSLRRPVHEGRGIGWFIPSGRTAKIGVALPRGWSRHLKPVLNRLVREYECEGAVFQNAVLGATGGLVPIDRRPLADRDLGLVVAGDARGGLGVDGAGIANAILSGELAGVTADRYASTEDAAVIGSYPDELDCWLTYDEEINQNQDRAPRSFPRWVEQTRQFFDRQPTHSVTETEP